MTRTLFALPLLALALLACSNESGGAPAAGPASRWSLSTEPKGSISVVDAQKSAPKDEVVVVGRLREFVEGLASFTLVDASVGYCGDPQDSKEKKMEDVCETPWDYCCHEKEAAEKQITVLVSDRAGAPAKGPVPELRNLDLVVVKGRLSKDKAGNVELAASGWYRKDRPPIPASVKFTK